MKNKKNFLRIYIVFLVILTISVIVLSVLGNKSRIGYLSDFEINVDNTLEINGLDKEETKQLFTIDYELDESAINHYILTNEYITTYSYDFKMRYYDKVFRNSDIYGVYPNLNNLPDYIQSAKMNDNRGTPFGNLISDKIIDFEKIDNINYNLKVKFFIITILFILILLIFVFRYFIYNYKKIIDSLSKYIDFYNNDNFTVYSDIYKKYKVSNILFTIYLIILGFIIFSTNFVGGPNNDIFWTGTNYNIFYNIYDFKGYFWQRGRHFADILMALYMRPFGTILINVFNVDPFQALMISKSLFTVIYVFLVSFSISLFIWTINNKKNYKLIFLLVSLYICNYANITYYITLACYVGGFGISMFVFYPMIYYFICGKEILFVKNKNMNYMLYFLLIYFATFSMEPTSTTLAGFSFFIILYIFIRKSKLFLDDNDSKPNIYILFILLSTIILTIISFLLTAFFSGRGNWQAERIADISIIESIINKFSDLQVFNKILILFGILYIFYILYQIIKNKALSKKNYIYFSICFTALFLILFFYSIDTPNIRAQLILLFSLLIIILIKNINNKNVIFSLLSNFIIFFLIFTMSLDLLKLHDITLKNYNTTFRDWNTVIQLYEDAYKNNLKEVVITKDDIEKLKLNKIFNKPPKEGYGYSENPNTHFNSTLSEFMERYYINKYIPIKVFYD